MNTFNNDLFLRACKRKPVERTPVWIMRQAGRYLPEYRAVREKHDFLTMCKTPELAAEVTIQPVNVIGVDAAIIFSDILVIPEAMGMHLEMHDGRGPVFPSPVRNEQAAKELKNITPEDDLKYVLDAISLTKKELNGSVPLIGFSGAPWTLLTYMVEGGGSKSFSCVKKLIYNNPELAHKILGKLTDAVADYLSAQLDAGADVVQIFDTWAG
ncbi:MAG: uroporphyrinogen decarboxylase, partial [Ignavibacteriaceae bacterium]|nr:uroporphyrinogen decarboxylase [Ignavibacteriaceae bacterium]